MSSNNTLIDKFSALGDKTRFKLLKLLSKNDEICVSELAQKVGISNAGVSQQLKVLEQAGLIERHRVGQKICYEINRSQPQNTVVIKLVEE